MANKVNMLYVIGPLSCLRPVFLITLKQLIGIVIAHSRHFRLELKQVFIKIAEPGSSGKPGSRTDKYLIRRLKPVAKLLYGLRKPLSSTMYRSGHLYLPSDVQHIFFLKFSTNKLANNRLPTWFLNIIIGTR